VQRVQVRQQGPRVDEDRVASEGDDNRYARGLQRLTEVGDRPHPVAQVAVVGALAQALGDRLQVPAGQPAVGGEALGEDLQAAALLGEAAVVDGQPAPDVGQRVLFADIVIPSARAAISRTMPATGTPAQPGSPVLMNQAFSANRQASRNSGLPSRSQTSRTAAMLARLTGWPPPELFVTVSITSGTAAARSASSAPSAATSLRRGLAAIPGVRLLGPDLDAETLPVATFTVEGVPHALVAARLAAEYAIGVGHSRFCAYPYLIRLLAHPRRGSPYRDQARREDRRAMPGAVRASAGINISDDDVRRLLAAVASIAAGDPPVRYHQDPLTCGFFPAESTFAERVPRARSG